MIDDTGARVAYWTGRVRAGRPLAFVPNYYRPLVRAALGMAPGPEMARLGFVGEPGPGRGNFVLVTRLGTVAQPWTPALAEGLGSVRLGEIVVDDVVARSVLDKFAAAERSLREAKEAERGNPEAARTLGLTAAIVRYQGQLDGDRAALDRARAAAQKALLIRTWQSLADADMAAVEAMSGAAMTLEEETAAVRAAPVRPPTTTPPVPADGRPPAGTQDVFPWWGYAAIGIGGAAALWGLVSLLAPSPAAA